MKQQSKSRALRVQPSSAIAQTASASQALRVEKQLAKLNPVESPPKLPLADDGTVDIKRLYSEVALLGAGQAMLTVASHRAHRNVLALVYAALHHLQGLKRSAQDAKLDELIEIASRSPGAGRTNKRDPARIFLRAMFSYAGSEKATSNLVHRDGKVLKSFLLKGVPPAQFVQALVDAGGIDKVARTVDAQGGQKSNASPPALKAPDGKLGGQIPRLVSPPPTANVSPFPKRPRLELGMTDFKRPGIYLATIHVTKSFDEIKLVRCDFAREVKGKHERERIAQNALDAVSMGGPKNVKR